MIDRHAIQKQWESVSGEEIQTRARAKTLAEKYRGWTRMELIEEIERQEGQLEAIASFDYRHLQQTGRDDF